MNMNMKSLVILSLIGLASLNTALADVNVDFSDMQYLEKNKRESIVPKTLAFNGELVAFAGKSVIYTDGLRSAVSFIDGQTQLSEIRRDALTVLAYSSAYTMQNATNSKNLQEHASVASSMAVCGYLGINEEMIFVIEKIFTSLTENNQDYKTNLIAGSMEQVDLTPYSRDSQFVTDTAMKCSENIKLWLK